MNGNTLRINFSCLIKIVLIPLSTICNLTACIEYEMSGSISPLTSLSTISACADNLDNDKDGWFDDEDPDCFDATATEEIGFGISICNDSLDNDGDNAIDAADTKCSNAFHPSEIIAEGEILISEFMPNPSAVSDSNGEWIELYNNTNEIIDLNGWSIRNSKNTSQIKNSILILPHNYIVLSRANNDVNGLSSNLGAIYQYDSTITLSNSGDSISVIEPSGSIITSITYMSKNVKDGASTIVNGELFDWETKGVTIPFEVEDSKNWCFSIQNIESGLGDKGSPNTTNENCSE